VKGISPNWISRLSAFFVAALVVLSLYAGADAEDTATTAPIEEPAITEADREHWAFQPLTRPEVPNIGFEAWPQNDIDRFILAKLEAAELTPQPEASRVTLIRRLSFDLTGLPPTPQEIDDFLSDSASDAYERLVDRLLASSAYGERWAQHWLDLARFAETDGFEHDHVRPHAWRYRDWVIDALNADMPYDQFVTWQIAGDEVAPNNPDAVVATGFLLCGPDMPDINSQAERRHVFLNDMTATVGAVFLGLNIGCAQCHDHKYDPVSQLDFYHFRALFDPMDLFKDRPLFTAEQREQLPEVEEQKRAKLDEIQGMIAAQRQKMLSRRQAEQEKPQLKLDDKQLLKQASAQEKLAWEKLQKQLRDGKQMQLPGLRMGRVAALVDQSDVSSHLMIRGAHNRPGPVVQPAFLRIAESSTKPKNHRKDLNSPKGRRTELARWLTRPDHPLATRVIVNRIWQHHFGVGLVDSPSNFGVMGREPTHPELLDWLATEFPRRGWSFKQLHRLIVTSATYRQVSKTPAGAEVTWEKTLRIDPHNELLSRMNRRRLEGEAIRDAMLAASDQLNRRQGGPGVRPPLPQELVQTLLKNQWPVTEDEREHRRRSVYLFVRRNLRYPLFEVFDRPDTNQSCPRRDRSTIAPQALTMLNSEFSLTAAKWLCGRLLEEAPQDASAQITACYRCALGRAPTEKELQTGLRFLDEDAEALRGASRGDNDLAAPDPLPAGVDAYAAAALTDYCLALFNLNEFLYID